MSEEKLKDGKNIYLTIDEPIQAIVEEELQRLVKEIPCKGAYMVMADPGTGDVLAMAQWPTFNPNDKKTMKPSLWINRMMSNTLDPGSVMKPVIVSPVANSAAPKIGLQM